VAEDKMPAMNLGEQLEKAALLATGGDIRIDRGDGKGQPPSVSLTDALKTKEEASGQIAEIQKQIKTLNERYESSSSEGKRLASELKERDKAVARLMQERDAAQSKLRTVQPFLERAENDPNFVQVLEDYVKNGSKGGARSTGVKMEDFGITQEDFSMTDALSKPGSPSGQYYNALRDQDLRIAEEKATRVARDVIKTELGAFTRQTQLEKAQEIDRVKRKIFLDAHPDMTNDDIDILLEKAKTVEWDYNDILVKVSPDRATTTTRRTPNEPLVAADRLNGLPITLAGRGSAGDGKGQQDASKAIMDLIKANMGSSIMEYASSK
jgi:hypothetical protein